MSDAITPTGHAHTQSQSCAAVNAPAAVCVAYDERDAREARSRDICEGRRQATWSAEKRRGTRKYASRVGTQTRARAGD
jgi:hypothetical protein